LNKKQKIFKTKENYPIMDEIDKKILHLLQEDDKIQYQKISEQLDIGASTVHYRIKKLINKGIIKNFSAVVDPEKAGYTTTAVLGLNVDPLKMDEVAKKLTGYDEVQVVTTASGDHDIIIQLIAKDGKHLWRFINENIKTIDGVEKKIHVSSFLDVYKRTNIIKFTD
jgi:Lrp/AsnC family transcriptional regulator, regulator for asnA, asnC and gidA